MGNPVWPRCHARKSFCAPPPREAAELLAQRLRRRLRKVVEQVIRELPPTDFLQKDFGAFAALRLHRRRLGKLRLLDRRPNLPRADLAEVEMRREQRRTVDVGPIAILVVARDRLADELLQPALGRRGADVPGVVEASVPGDARQQLQAHRAAATSATSPATAPRAAWATARAARRR